MGIGNYLPGSVELMAFRQEEGTPPRKCAACGTRRTRFSAYGTVLSIPPLRHGKIPPPYYGEDSVFLGLGQVRGVIKVWVLAPEGASDNADASLYGITVGNAEVRLYETLPLRE